MKTHYIINLSEWFDGTHYEELIKIIKTGKKGSTYKILKNNKWTSKKPQMFPKYLKCLKEEKYNKNDDLMIEYKLRELNMTEDAEYIIENNIEYALFNR